MKEEKYYYLINVCENGTVQTVRCESWKEKEQWLIEYFSSTEKWWAWDKYSEYAGGTITFEKFIKMLIKRNSNTSNQTFYIRKGKAIIIQRKEK